MNLTLLSYLSKQLKIVWVYDFGVVYDSYFNLLVQME
jgi:hypothetical protein